MQVKAKQETNWEKLRKVDLRPKLPIFCAVEKVSIFDHDFYKSSLWSYIDLTQHEYEGP